MLVGRRVSPGDYRARATGKQMRVRAQPDVRCASDDRYPRGAHRSIFDVARWSPVTRIRTVIRKVTSGIPGRNSHPLFEQFATFRKTRQRYLLRKIGVLQIARCWAQSRKTDHFFRFVFAEKFRRDRHSRILLSFLSVR